jgi:hypothetical protein
MVGLLTVKSHFKSHPPPQFYVLKGLTRFGEEQVRPGSAATHQLSKLHMVPSICWSAANAPYMCCSISSILLVRTVRLAVVMGSHLLGHDAWQGAKTSRAT